jgi:hypothetical protein
MREGLGPLSLLIYSDDLLFSCQAQYLLLRHSVSSIYGSGFLGVLRYFVGMHYPAFVGRAAAARSRSLCNFTFSFLFSIADSYWCGCLV